MLAAGVNWTAFPISQFLSCFFINVVAGVFTSAAALYFDISFWVGNMGMMTLTLLSWSLACAGITVVTSTLCSHSASANATAYSVSILSSLVATLISAVLFGIAAEVILGDDAVREHASEPPIVFPELPLLLMGLLWPHLPLARIFYVAHHANVMGGNPDPNGVELRSCVSTLSLSCFPYLLLVLLVERGRFDKQKRGVIRKGTGASSVKSLQEQEQGAYSGFELAEIKPNLQGELLGGRELQNSDLTEDDTILALRDISKVYQKGTFALQGVTFEVKVGQCCGLLGKNGAGKSTIQNIISGYLEHTSGIVCLRTNRIGWCRQNNTLWDALTVWQHMSIYASAIGLKNRTAVINDILIMSHLCKVSEREVKSLSGGMRRRLCASIALMIGRNGGLVMLDEPSSGLDLKSSRNIWRGIKDVMKESSCGVLLTTHNGEEAEVLCDDVVVMSQGAVVSNDPLEVEDSDKIELTILVYTKAEEADKVIRSLSNMFGDNVEIDGGRICFKVLGRDVSKAMSRLREVEGEIVWRIIGGAKSIDDQIGER